MKFIDSKYYEILTVIKEDFNYGSDYSSNILRLLESNDESNIKLGKQLIEGCLKGIKQCDYSPKQINEISLRYNYGSYTLIRVCYSKSIANKIIEIIKKRCERRGKNYFLSLKKTEKIECLIYLKYNKIRKEIDRFFISKIPSSYVNYGIRGKWLNSDIRHTNKIDEFIFRLRYNNTYRNGFYEFKFDFYTWMYEYKFIQGVGHCVLFYPKSMMNIENKVVYILVFLYNGFSFLKGFLVRNEFKKKNITDIKKKLREYNVKVYETNPIQN